MTGSKKEQNEVEIGGKEKKEKETRTNRTEGKRQKQYLATIGDGPVVDGGRLRLAHCTAVDDVEAHGVGTGVTIAQEHLLDLKLYHK